jgi:sulfofructose kinase
MSAVSGHSRNTISAEQDTRSAAGRECHTAKPALPRRPPSHPLRRSRSGKPRTTGTLQRAKYYVYPKTARGKIIRRTPPLISSCARTGFPYSVSVPQTSSVVDMIGVGLNATDTIIRLPHFPAFNSKVEFRVSEVLPGGQVATAVTACARWGLKARYVGKIGDDPAGLVQQNEMRKAGIEAHWVVVPHCQSQSSFILVDEVTGERTVLWKRDARLELLPTEIHREWVIQAKLLHVDGHDCAAATQAARWARSAGIPVTADLDNLYPGVEALLESVDYAIASREFHTRLCGEGDPFVSLPAVASRFGCGLTAATLGSDGVLAWDGDRFHYSPAFDLKPVDTTGAGDVFHAGFAYSLLRGDDLSTSLEFSCAAAGLACMGNGARGGIASLEGIEELIRNGRRRPTAFTADQLKTARMAR